MTAGRSPCPLCGGTDGSERWATSYDEVWTRLQDEWGVVLTAATRRANAPSEHVALVRCDACGLDRFDPMAPGDPDFYREVMTAVPYHGDRWEFGVVRSDLLAGEDLLDLGCGEGAFLRTLGPRLGRTVGLDHHGPAIERLRADGFEAYARSFESFASTEAGRFDVATAFHVLEHLADPVAAVAAASACLRPGGTLYVSVPDRERVPRSDAEVLDGPPHHVTRWSGGQLRRLGEIVGLECEDVRHEPPDLSAVRTLAQETAGTRLRLHPDSPSWGLAKAWGRVSIGPRRYRRAVKGGTWVGRFPPGHSMIALMRRPDRSTA